ncbi:MAG: hypothetical protein NUV77_25835, partial [Thermoguttaceae bacterium]|nr:hypothetical protein [Thermoguttaceae bacterium]
MNPTVKPSIRVPGFRAVALVAAMCLVVAVRAGVPAEPTSIVVAPSAGGVMIASDDAQALDEFAQLLTALAGGVSGHQEETTVFYLKHARAESVAELVEAIFGGGSLAANGGAEDPVFAPPGPFGSGGGGFFPGGAPGAGPFGPFGPRGPGQGGVPFGAGGDARFARGGPGAAFPRDARRSSGATEARRPTTSRSAGVRITPDARLNALIVQASPDDTDIIEELLKILDQKPIAETIPVESKPRVIPLRNIPVQAVAEILRQLYQDRLTNGGGGSAASGARPDGSPQGPSPQGPGGPQEFLQQMVQLRGAAGPRGGARRGGGDDVPKMAIGADVRTNSLVVVAPEALYAEVRALVDQLDQPTGQNEETMQVVALRGANSDVLRQALTAFMGERVRIGDAPPSVGTRQPGAGVASARRTGLGRSAVGGLPADLGPGESRPAVSTSAPAGSLGFPAGLGGSRG